MKILYFAPANSIHSHKWIDYFVSKGHEIYWISLHEPNKKLSDKINFYKLTIKKVNFLFDMYKLSRNLSKKNIDILHVHSVGLYGFVSLFFNFGKKVATTWGSDIIFSEKNIFKKPFIRKVLNRSDVITCDAEHMRRRMAGFGVDLLKIKTINFGVDTQLFSRIDTSEKGGEALKVISIRNLEPVYDIPTVINSIPTVVETFPNVKFLIAGSGSLENQLKGQVKDLKVEKYVNFTGSISFDHLPEFFSSADIYVSTSLSDAGLSSSTAEAMSCELPVIITDSGENNLWIDNKTNGLLIPVQDPVALGGAINELAEDNEKRKLMGIAARKTIIDRNDYNSEMLKVEQLYESLIG